MMGPKKNGRFIIRHNGFADRPVSYVINVNEEDGTVELTPTRTEAMSFGKAKANEALKKVEGLSKFADEYTIVRRE